MKCPFEISWELVTREIAQSWLDSHNDRNRPLKNHTVDAYAGDMAADRWCPNHQGVAFSKEDGRLLDGQHRLAAIVISGKAQWMLVFRGVPDRVEGVEASVMDTIDRGVTRSIADLLRLGHGMQQEANVIAAACLQVARICVPHPEIQARKATMPQTVGVLKLYQDEMRWLASERTSQKGLRNAALSGTIAFARAVAPAEASRFYEVVKEGNARADSPAMLVRSAVLQERMGFKGGALWERCRAGAIILDALRATMRGLANYKLPRPGDCTDSVEWFRGQQVERVLAVRGLFPMLRTTDSKPWPPPPASDLDDEPELISRPVPAIIEPGAAAERNYRPTKAAERLLSRARKEAVNGR